MAAWRDSGLPIKFFSIDGRVVIFLFLALYSMSMTTILLAVFGVVALKVMESYGYTLPNAYRRIHLYVMGKRRYAVSSRRRMRMTK